MPERASGVFQPTNAGASLVQLSVVPVDGQPFHEAMQAVVTRQPTNSWDCELNTRNAAPIQQGDTILCEFYARALAPKDGSARINFNLEVASPPYDKSVYKELYIGAAWQRVDVPFQAKNSLAAGAGNVNFVVGYLGQTVEIGGIRLIDYGKEVRLDQLPMTRQTYAGREPDAAWRRAAQKRIDLYRKGNITVRVVAPDGRPVPGASVSVEMQRHAFRFGSAIAAGRLTHTDPYDIHIQQQFLKLFNQATLENELKWGPWPDDRQTPTDAVAWLRKNGATVRGHNLVWPGWRYLPADLHNNYLHRAETSGSAGANAWLEKQITDHITDEVGSLRGQCLDWDVVNEPYENPDLENILGPQAMTAWFQAAHKADPGARLFLNDFGVFGEDGDPAHVPTYLHTIRSLLSSGAPLGGIGLESHFSSLLVPPEELSSKLGLYARFHLPLEVTEFDFPSDDKQLQADYSRDFFTVMFSDPAVKSITVWGFWDSAHWLGDAPIYNADWTLKPSGKAITDLLFHQWWTNTTGQTDAQGLLQTRGFLGDYVITAKTGSSVMKVNATLLSSGTQVKIVLPH